MPTNYPGSLDSYQRPSASDTMDTAGVQGDVVVDNLYDAVEAIEGELGTAPSAAYATVKARLDALSLGWKNFVTDYGAVADGSTDNTAALQAWIDANPDGGTLYVPAGIYQFTAAQTSGTALTVSYTGQVLLPARDITQARAVFRIVGDRIPGMVQWGNQTGDSEPAYAGGSIFRSTATSGNFISCIPGFDNGAFKWTNSLLDLEKLTIRVPNNPVVTAVHAQRIISLRMLDVSVDVNAAAASVSQPTTTTQYGIYCPAENNSALISLKNVQVIGQYNGIRHSEHAVLDNFCAQMCRIGILVDKVPHNAVYTRVLLQLNNTHIKSAGATAFLSGAVSFESKTSGGWWTTTYDIDDFDGWIAGVIWWEKNGLATSTLLLNNARSLALHSLATMATAASADGVVARATFGNLSSGTTAGLGADDIAGLSFVMVGTSVAASRIDGKAKFTAGSAQLFGLLNVPNAGREVSCLIKLSATSNRASPGLALRYADSNNSLIVFINKDSGGNQLSLQKIVSGTYTTLATAMVGTLVNGTEYDVRAKYVDGRVTVYVDDVKQINHELSSANAAIFSAATYTYCGIQMYAGGGNDDLGSLFDNLTVRAA